MSQRWIDKLCALVDQSTDLEGLARIMPHVGVDVREIQNLMKQKIKELDSTAAKRAAFNVVPIQSILPIDSLQHILSFHHHSDLRIINKTFKKCYGRNQAIYNRSRRRIAEDHAHHFAPDIPYDDSANQTFVVRSDGEPFTKSVDSLGNVVHWTGSIDDLISDHINSGDRILFQEGDYQLQRLSCCNKALQIIGMGDSVNIMFHEYTAMRIDEGSMVLLYNINVSFKCVTPYGIEVGPNSKLWIEKCMFHSESHMRTVAVLVKGEGFVGVKASIFIGQYIGLMVEENPKENVSIIACLFKDCKFCVKSAVPLRCIGNMYVDSRESEAIVLEYQTEGLTMTRGSPLFVGCVHNQGMWDVLDCM